MKLWWSIPASLLAISTLGSLLWVTRPEFYSHERTPHETAVTVSDIANMRRKVNALYCKVILEGKPLPDGECKDPP